MKTDNNEFLEQEQKKINKFEDRGFVRRLFNNGKQHKSKRPQTSSKKKRPPSFALRFEP